jgi:hypothetical protein
VVWPSAGGVVSACASSRFDCFFRMKAAPGGGAATGHIGRSFAEWIEWCIRVCVDPCPRSHQPAKVSWTKGSCPWIRLGGHQPTVGHRPWPSAGTWQASGYKPTVLSRRHGFSMSGWQGRRGLAAHALAHPGSSRLHLEWLAWACGAPTGAMSVHARHAARPLNRLKNRAARIRLSGSR